jgi:hypothetical protein
MKRILIPLLTVAMLTFSVVAPFAIGAPKVYADPDGALTNSSFAAAGRYAIAADGIGLNGKDDSTEAEFRTIQFYVPAVSSEPTSIGRATIVARTVAP